MTSWTKPRTWVAAQSVTAAALNTDLRDNLKNIDERLTLHGIASESTLNKVKAAACGWRLTDTGTQDIAPYTDEGLTWDTETTDTDGFHGSGTPALVTIPAGFGGYYLVTAAANWAAGPGIVRIWVTDASGNVLGKQVDNPAASGTTTQTLTFLALLSAGDVIHARASHDDSGNVTVTKSAAYTFFAGYRVFAT